MSNPLIRACHEDNLSAAKKNISFARRLSQSGETALMTAIRARATSCVEFMVTHESGIFSRHQETALMIAAKLNYPEYVKLLLNSEGKLHQPSGLTALMYAAQSGAVPSARLLVKVEAGMSLSRDVSFDIFEGSIALPKGSTALMIAVIHRRKELIRLLLPYEQKVRNAMGRTALYYAQETKDSTILSLFNQEQHAFSGSSSDDIIEITDSEEDDGEDTASDMDDDTGEYMDEGSGPDTDEEEEEDEGSNSPAERLLELLRCNHREEAVEYGRGYRDFTPLMKGAILGDVKLVVGSLRHLKKHFFGLTALMLASFINNIVVLPHLRAEMRLQDDDKTTALMLAASNNCVECVKFLLDDEAGMKEADGGTALMRAAVEGHTACIKVLIGPEAKLTDDDGNTALIWAAMMGRSQAVELLRKDELGMQTVTGMSALMYAAERGNADCVKLLLDEAGKQVSCSFDLHGRYIQKGMTALMLAAFSGRMKVLTLLASTELSIRDSMGHDAIDYARSFKTEDSDSDQSSKEMVKYLMEQQKIVEKRMKVEPEVRTESETSPLTSPSPSPSTSLTSKKLARTVTFATDGNSFLDDLVAGKRITQEQIRNCTTIQTEEGLNSLMIAAYAGADQNISSLKGWMRAKSTSYGLTALMCAAASNQVSSIYRLGDEVQIITKEEMNILGTHIPAGATALIIAILRGNYLASLILQRSERDINDAAGVSPADHALRTGNYHILDLLVDHPIPQTITGQTHLMIAADMGEIEQLKTYTKQLGCQDEYGWTALMYAIRAGHSECVKALLDEINISNNANETPLMFAVVMNQNPYDSHFRKEYGVIEAIIRRISVSKKKKSDARPKPTQTPKHTPTSQDIDSKNTNSSNNGSSINEIEPALKISSMTESRSRPSIVFEKGVSTCENKGIDEERDDELKKKVSELTEQNTTLQRTVIQLREELAARDEKLRLLTISIPDVKEYTTKDLSAAKQNVEGLWNALQYHAARNAVTLCRVCKQAPVTSLCVPCGHVFCCFDCGKKLKDGKCQVCGMAVTGLERLTLEGKPAT
ncbi:Ankyrin repeat protein 2 [Giardia muris]|uniref:Ankyrin repeat protein 2 n=1 Tax=Giardia muris TaxID=5742 RepID=A0A4Z1T870_GIAMU|nr:Ankyrin repeat protein 2 [Giardia muris]|eukprot:TNJ28691.1 Ankyrin repeat protein 2 [Giardia muris]